MERRRFLTSTGLGLAATGLGLALPWPSFLTRAFGDEAGAAANGPRARTVELGEAIARARRDGRPLLVFVVPTEAHNGYQRGYQFGELINHGGSGVTDDLLICELACATVAETRSALTLDVTGEPEMLVIELDADGAERLPCRSVELPKRPHSGKSGEEEEASIRQRITAGAAALHAAVLPRERPLAMRAERNRAALSEADRVTLAAGLEGGAIDPTLAHRAAASLLLVAIDGAADARSRARAALDAAAAKHVVETRPAGAQWAKSGGCGVAIEGDSNAEVVGCGMGRVPALSQRFLHFYAKP